MRFFYYSFIFLASILLIDSSFNNPKCKGLRYLCGEENQPLVCVNRSDYRQKVYMLQQCPSGKYCPYNSNFTNNTISCVDNIPANKTLPGESCSQNQDCYSVKCVNGICKGASLDQSCKTHEDCDPGYFCNISHCSKQVVFAQVK